MVVIVMLGYEQASALGSRQLSSSLLVRLSSIYHFWRRFSSNSVVYDSTGSTFMLTSDNFDFLPMFDRKTLNNTKVNLQDASLARCTLVDLH